MLAGQRCGEIGCEEQDRSGALLRGWDLADRQLLGSFAVELLYRRALRPGGGLSAAVEAFTGHWSQEDTVHACFGAQLEGGCPYEAGEGRFRCRVGTHRGRVPDR